MDVPLSVVADYANTTADGKLNIMGVFGRVTPAKVPFALPTSFLVFVIRYTAAERGSPKPVEVRLLDPDGVSLYGVSSDVLIPGDAAPSGEAVQILGFNNLLFQRYGPHAFHILIDGDEKAQIAIDVVPPPTPTPQREGDGGEA
jgi:hypothetical protein